MTNLHDNFTLEVPHVTLPCNLCRMKRDVIYVTKLHFYVVKLLCHVTYFLRIFTWYIYAMLRDKVTWGKLQGKSLEHYLTKLHLILAKVL